LAIRSNGTAVSWGRNTYGNLGNGSTNNSSTPVAVSNLSNVVELAGGTNYSLALTADNSLFAFGRNPEGQLGFGNTNDAIVPTLVDSLCITNPSGIAEAPTHEAIHVFPNPSEDGIFNLHSGNNITHLAVYDVSGKMVYESGHFTTSKNVIDLSNQQSGIYIVRMEFNNSSYNVKLIKP
jgi:hypothetical protein